MGYGLAGCPGVGDGEGRRWPGVQQVLKVTVLLQWDDMFFGEVGYRDTLPGEPAGGCSQPNHL